MKEYSFIYCFIPEIEWWKDLLEDLFEDIDKHIKEQWIEWFRITYIKEKYWWLRLEYEWSDEYIFETICYYESTSHNICQVCSRYWKWRWWYWIKTLCNSCYKE